MSTSLAIGICFEFREIGKIKDPQNLEPGPANELKEKLKEQLSHLEDRKAEWRKGIELQGHHLANVREGALLGFGINTDVSLLEKLYWKRKETDKPWFRHAL